MFSSHRDLHEDLLHIALKIIVLLPNTYLAEICGHAANILIDGHIVIVQHNKAAGLDIRHIIHGLIYHATCEGAISDHCGNLLICTLDTSGTRHSKRSGNGC